VIHVASLAVPCLWQDFDTERWARIRARSEAWWNASLEGPLIQLLLAGPGQPSAVEEREHHRHIARYGSRVSAEEIVETRARALERVYHLGDACPVATFSPAPVCAAAFLGCDCEVTRSSVWTRMEPSCDPAALSLRYDPDNAHLVRFRRVCRAAQARFGDRVLVPLPSLGHNLDLLAPFVDNNRLLVDLYDQPAEIERLVWEIHACWFDIVEDIDRALGRPVPGYAGFNLLYSSTPCYNLQCDFSAMISTEMFCRFALPEIVASARRLGRATFHLDGPGMLPHLDSILEVPEIAGVQWVPGPMGGDVTRDIDIYRRIRKAGKRIELSGPPEHLDLLVDLLGSAEGVYFRCTPLPLDRAERAAEFLMRYGIE